MSRKWMPHQYIEVDESGVFRVITPERRAEMFACYTNESVQEAFDTADALPPISVDDAVRGGIDPKMLGIATPDDTRGSQYNVLRRALVGYFDISAPSRLGDWLLLVFMPKKDRLRLVDDLHEEYYDEIIPRVGEKGARSWYWVQVGRSIWPVIGGSVSKIVRWLVTDGWELIKRLAGG